MRCKSSSRRIGFTLPEVMVVVAIVGLLAALLMPALTRALARGRLTQCMNNQYQIAFALVHYNEKQGSIPGWMQRIITTSATAASGTAGAACCWAVPLLPFLGRSDVYDTWPLLPNSPVIATFACPANRPSKPLGYPLLHYAANIGVSGTAWHDGVFLNLLATGVKAISLDDIADADGTSTTLAFAEKSGRGFQPHTWTYASVTTPPGGLFGSGTAKPPVYGVATPPGPSVYPVINGKSMAIPPATLATRDFAPHSEHVGGAVVAFCDGHTAFVSGTIKAYEYAQLLTPKSRWQGGSNKWNTSTMDSWLRTNGQSNGPPYLLDEAILKQ